MLQISEDAMLELEGRLVYRIMKKINDVIYSGPVLVIFVMNGIRTSYITFQVLVTFKRTRDSSIKI
jgi:hypothetical protein